MEVNEIMQHAVTCLDSRSSILDASDLMERESIRHIPVTERGQVVGIVSDRDLRPYMPEQFLSQGQSEAEHLHKQQTLKSVMQSKPIAVDPSTELDEAIDILLENKIGALLVVDSNEQLRGIITYEDVLRFTRDQIVSSGL
jgi:acetoin utilization protein AcuB